MNPYVKMYLITESDRKLLMQSKQQLRQQHQSVSQQQQTPGMHSIFSDRQMDNGGGSSSSSIQRRTKEEVINDDESDHGSDDADSELDRMQDRLDQIRHVSLPVRSTPAARDSSHRLPRQTLSTSHHRGPPPRLSTIDDDSDNAVDFSRFYQATRNDGGGRPVAPTEAASTVHQQEQPDDVAPPPPPPMTPAAPSERKRWKPKKVKCKVQLKECQDRLANCMRILRWHTVDGRTFSASGIPKFVFPTSPLSPTTPYLIPYSKKRAAPVVAKIVKTKKLLTSKKEQPAVTPTPHAKTPRAKRTRVAPKRFIESIRK